MPQFDYGGRRWRFAGDELSLPSLCSIAARLAYAVFIAAVFALTAKDLQRCGDGWVIELYLSLSLALFCAAIVCDVLLARTSLRGTLTDSAPRERLAHFLNAKIVLCVLQTLCAVWGILSVSRRSEMPCAEDFRDSPVTVGLVLLVVALQFSEWLTYFCGFFCLQTANREGEEDPDRVVSEWESRCRSVVRTAQWLTCSLFGGHNVEEGFEQVARVLTTFFHHDGFLDVVASDIVAGILLVRVEQRALRKRQGERSVTLTGEQSLLLENVEIDLESGSGGNKLDYHTNKPARNNLTNSNNNNNSNITRVNSHGINLQAPLLAERDRLEDRRRTNKSSAISLEEHEALLRLSVYALSAYSHLIFLYMHPCSGLCRLTCYRGLCNCLCLNKQDFPVVGDGSCNMHTAGMDNIRRYLTDSDVVYASFRNDTTHKPFVVYLDHSQKWLVVSVRGTLSLEDCLTDATCEPFELSETGRKYGFQGENRWCHDGFFRAAEAIYEELESKHIISELIGEGPGRKYPNYRLVITGHSLGAGIASTLSLLYKQSYKDLVCYSFGTPASCFDEQLAQEVSPFMTSVVLGHDLVCRLNIHSLSKLRNEVLDAVSRASVNKMTVMRAVYTNFSPEELMHPKGCEPDSEFKRSLAQFKEKSVQNMLKFHKVQLTIPGRIVHFQRTVIERSMCRKKVIFVPSVRDRSEFANIILSTTMGTDHLPDKYFYELQAARDYALHGSTIV